MPLRFRKSFKIFPGVRANVSKSGVSFTVGAKGYHLNFSKRGVKQTVGIPGSGISQSSYLVKNDPDSEAVTKKEKDEGERTRGAETIHLESKDESVREPSRHRTSAWVLLLSVIVVYIGAVIFGLIPMNFISQVLHTLTEWARGMGL